MSQAVADDETHAFFTRLMGLNMKGVPATERLEALPAGQMCNYKVRLTGADQVDAELLGWLRTAYETSG